MDLKKQLGKRIREIRVKKGLKQAELAEMVGIDPKHQSCVENGRNFPSASLLENYAQKLNLQLSDLLLLTEYNSKEAIQEDIIRMVKSADEETTKLLYRVVTAIII